MTVVVAVAADGDVVMGIDSGVCGSVEIASATKGLVGYDLDGHPGLLVGAAGLHLIGNELAWRWSPPAPEGDDPIVYFWACAVSLRDHFTAEPLWSLVKEDGHLDGGFLLGWRGTVCEVDSIFAVDVPVSGYMAIGNGQGPALGALYAGRQFKPERRVMGAMEAADAHVGGIRPPFSVRWAGR